MEVLIHTVPADVHAAGVHAVLTKSGIKCKTWYTGDFPSAQTISIYVGGEAQRYKVKDSSEHFEFPSRPFDVVWHRRLPPPQKADRLIEPCDVDFVSQEISYVLRNAIPLIGKDAFWVNGYYESVHADKKLVQLDAALDVGLKIPETLVTNAPDDIRRFLADSGQAVIYKPMRGFNWREKGRQLITYTRVITPDDLPEDTVLELCPGIFQHYIPKAFEVRATFMGNECFAAALFANDKHDWRVSSEKGELRAEAYRLPLDVYEKCVALMKKLKIVFGCIDIVVTPFGEHIFLEVNEMGQFLWVEEMLPEYPLLDAFCAFLSSKNPDFTYRPSSDAVGWADIRKSAELAKFLKAGDAHSHKTTAL